MKYLLAFDVKYRERRLHFLIKGQNRLYQLHRSGALRGLDPLVVDRLKREFYGRLDALRRRENAEFYSREVRDLVADIIPGRALGRGGQASRGLCGTGSWSSTSTSSTG